MKRLFLTAVIATTLCLGAVTANAEPIPANPMPGQSATPAAKTSTLNVDFGKMPEGWKYSRNPNGEPRGMLNIISHATATARLIVIATDAEGKTLGDIAKELAEQIRGDGHKAADPTKNKDGSWSIEVTIIEEGQKTGSGFALIRSFKNDPDGIYIFNGMWATATDAKISEQARTMAKTAKLK